MKRQNLKPPSYIKQIFFYAIILFLSSCVTQRQVEYVQHKDKKTVETFSNESFKGYTIKSNDELYIHISSLDEASANVFSSNASSQSIGNLNNYGAYLMSYTVDKDGFVELPIIGRLKVEDKTVADISVLIRNSLTNVLNQPVVTVKLVNRYISVLGEVRNPGHFVYSQEKLSVFDAIGLAGDITLYGNRKNVILLRGENNSNNRIELNLTKSDFLTSEYYYLRPGDVLYVKPMRNRFWGMGQFPFAVVLSSITTMILVLNYIN